MIRLWPQQRSPPAYCRELHVGLRCASRSANGYAGAGGTQFLTKELQPVPPVEQSEPSVPASHTQVGEPSAFVSVMVAWWCALWYAKTGEEPYAVRKFIVAGASADASKV